MEHPYIDVQLIVERYALGKLAPEETARFERHYLHCQDCLEQVTLADRLHRGFKQTATDRSAKSLPGHGSMRRLSLFGLLSRSRS